MIMMRPTLPRSEFNLMFNVLNVRQFNVQRSTFNVQYSTLKCLKPEHSLIINHCLRNRLGLLPVASIFAHLKRPAVPADEIPHQLCLQSTTFPSLCQISTLDMQYSAFIITTFSLFAFCELFLYVIS